MYVNFCSEVRKLWIHLIAAIECSCKDVAKRFEQKVLHILKDEKKSNCFQKRYLPSHGDVSAYVFKRCSVGKSKIKRQTIIPFIRTLVSLSRKLSHEMS